jgi:two-component system chemotaxis response regulator CheB
VSEPPIAQQFPVVIGVGASAGGVEALSQLVGALPGGFAAPMVVVLHVAPSGRSVLAQILDRHSALDVVTAADGLPLRPGCVFVAPPDQHLEVRDGAVCLSRAPRENGHRPAVDPTFRSIAGAYGRRAVGVILSGTRDDGSRGLAAIKAAGGRALVQDPATCLYDGMPANAIRATHVDAVLPITGIAQQLITMAGDPPKNPLHAVTDVAGEITTREGTRFTCPDCGGVLFQESQNGAETYVCSIGHAYSPDSLDDEQARQLESALWAAVRSLEDRVVLLRRLAERAASHGQERSRSTFEAQARDAAERAELIRDVVARPAPPQPDAA